MRGASRRRRRATVGLARVREKSVPGGPESAVAARLTAPMHQAVSDPADPDEVLVQRAAVHRAPERTEDDRQGIVHKGIVHMAPVRRGIVRKDPVPGMTVPLATVPLATAPLVTVPLAIARGEIVREATVPQARARMARGHRVSGPKVRDLREAIRRSPQRTRSVPKEPSCLRGHPSRLSPLAWRPNGHACRTRACRGSPSGRPCPTPRRSMNIANCLVQSNPIRRKARASALTPVHQRDRSAPPWSA